MTESQGVPEQPQRRGRAATVIVAGGMVLAIGAAVAWWMTSRAPEQAAPAPSVVAAPAPVAAPTAPLEGSDTAIQSWAEKLSAHTDWLRWLQSGDLARRLVATLQRIAEGESPRPMLGFLGPSTPFEVVERGGKTFVAPASWQRYDTVAAVIESIDAQKAAQAWRELEPIFETAHREIAPPGSTVRRSLDLAIEKLLAVQLPTDAAAVEVEAKGALYAFKDPQLEALQPAQKHLVRFGPDNARVVQNKLRELQTALRP